LTVAVAVVSPLKLTKFNCQVLLETTARNFTVIPTICPMAVTTSPYSKDTTLLQGNVENIFLVALTQMINPGNPFLYAFGPSVSNMRTGHDLYYTIEKVDELIADYKSPVPEKITLHTVKDKALADTENQAYIVEKCRKYSNAKLVSLLRSRLLYCNLPLLQSI